MKKTGVPGSNDGSRGCGPWCRREHSASGRPRVTTCRQTMYAPSSLWTMNSEVLGGTVRSCKVLGRLERAVKFWEIWYTYKGVK